MRKWRLRFTLKQMLAVTSGVAIAFSLGLTLLFRPYCLTGTYGNGVRAWEQWEQYSWSLQPLHMRTVRFYRNGKVSMISEGSRKTYWDLDGNEVDAATFYQLFKEQGSEVGQDADSNRPLSFVFGE